MNIRAQQWRPGNSSKVRMASAGKLADFLVTIAPLCSSGCSFIFLPTTGYSNGHAQHLTLLVYSQRWIRCYVRVGERGRLFDWSPGSVRENRRKQHPHFCLTLVPRAIHVKWLMFQGTYADRPLVPVDILSCCIRYSWSGKDIMFLAEFFLAVMVVHTRPSWIEKALVDTCLGRSWLVYSLF